MPARLSARRPPARGEPSLPSTAPARPPGAPCRASRGRGRGGRSPPTASLSRGGGAGRGGAFWRPSRVTATGAGAPAGRGVFRGVHPFFHPPAWLDRGRWEDRRPRLVCIVRDIPRAWIEALLEALEAEVREVTSR